MASSQNPIETYYRPYLPSDSEASDADSDTSYSPPPRSPRPDNAGPDISDEDIERVLNEVSLHIFDLPNGLDTHVGGAGEKVSAASGGQLKKIAIARALLRSPRLIIADEPSTDLDDASVEVVMDALRNRTTHGAILICVTHDLSLPELPDRVIKVERHSP